MPQLPDISRLSIASGHSAAVLGLYPLTTDRALSIDESGLVLIWDLTTDRAYRLFQTVGAVSIADVSLRGQVIALGSGVTVDLFSLMSGERVITPRKLETRTASLAFDPAGESIVIGGADGRIYRWRFAAQRTAETMLERERLLERYIGPPAIVSAVAFHPWGRFFFSGDWRGGFSAWALYTSDIFGGAYDKNVFINRTFAEEAKRDSASRNDSEPVSKILLSRDGQNIVLSTQGGELEWWEVRGLKFQAQVQAHRGLVYDADLSIDATMVASAGRDGMVRVWKLDPGSPLAVPKIAPSFVMQQEVPIANVRKIAFVSSRRLMAGDARGQVLSVEVK